MKKRKNQKGNLLLTLIVASLVLLLVALSLGVLTHQSVIHKTLSTKTRAQSAAKSITTRAVVEFQMEPSFGTPAHADYSKVLEWTAADGSTAKLTFDPDVADDLGIPHSTNNFEGETPVRGGAGYDVPPGTVELVGYGEAYGESRTMRNIISVPPYDFAVATNGGFASSGNLLVGTLPAGVNPVGLRIDDLLPAHLVAARDVELQGNASILGNVQAGAKVRRAGAVDIRGEIYEDTPPPELPTVDIDEYRTSVPYSGTIDSSGSATLDENTLHTGDINLVGTLTINDAVLFVDGDLTVQGGATGVGAIICTGNITFNNAADFTGNQQVAILSKGDVTLRGAGQTSLFRGMVYTEGRFSADGITILGSFVSNKPQPIGTTGSPDALPQIELNNVTLVHTDSDVRFSSRATQVSSGSQSLPGFAASTGSGNERFQISIGGTFDSPRFGFLYHDGDRPSGSSIYGNRLGSLYFANFTVPLPLYDNYTDEAQYEEDYRAAIDELAAGLQAEIEANWTDRGSTRDLRLSDLRQTLNSVLYRSAYKKTAQDDADPGSTGTGDPGQTEVMDIDFDFNKFINLRSSVRSVYLGPI